METNTVTTLNSAEVSIDRILSLNNEINGLRNQLSSKDREIGTLESANTNLEDQVSELKSKIEDKTPQVRIVTLKPTSTRWGDTYNETSVEYKNLSSVQDDIRKELETKFKKDLDTKDAAIKSLNKTIEESATESERKIKVITSDYARYELELKMDTEKRRRKMLEDVNDKNLEIEKLQKEIVKIKEDKTDAQLEAKRIEEIKTLKLRIKELTDKVNELASTGIFKRMWFALTAKSVRIEAERQDLERRREVEKIGVNQLRGIMDIFGTRWC